MKSAASLVSLISLIFKTELGQLFTFWILKKSDSVSGNKAKLWDLRIKLLLLVKDMSPSFEDTQLVCLLLSNICTPSSLCLRWLNVCALLLGVHKKNLCFHEQSLPYSSSLIICVNQASHGTKSCRDSQVMPAACAAATGSTQAAEEAGDRSA